jgi:hypothetical protein
MERVMSDGNTDREVILAKLQYDHQLAELGLSGTLKGACAALVAIVAIAVVQIWLDRYVVQGWSFAAMVAVIVIPVTFYGAFIFNRALNVSAKVEKSGGSFSASSSEREASRPARPHRAG